MDKNSKGNVNKKRVVFTDITDNLNDIDVLYVTKVVKSGKLYTLKGVIFTRYTITNSQLKNIKDKGFITINNKDFAVKDITAPSEYDLKEYEVYGDDLEYPAYKIKQLDSKTLYLECQAQIIDAWKQTNEYKKITIPADTLCISGYPVQEETTVGEYFKDYQDVAVRNVINPDSKHTFRFEFENGKCIKVIDACTRV